MKRRLRSGTVCVALLVLMGATNASASVVRHGYLPLTDGTKLNYTLTLPKADGRYPIVLEYDPYYAGATSDPTWNDSGYAMLGVNFRGTGCSEGTFNPTRADIWGRDGAQVVDWAAMQPWSDGNIGMLGFSFTGTSQIATAAYAGPALKAIMPGNVFPDMYRDLVYPGGIYNSWIAVWVAVRNYALGTAAVTQVFTDPACANGLVQQVVPNESQTLDTALYPFIDSYWTRQPATLAGRVHIPILGCVDWQDTTVQSRGFNEFRDDFAPATTWVVGGDGAHGDCPISRARRVRFLDHYLKKADNGWPRTPRLVIVHEVPAAVAPGRDLVPENAGKWQSSFATWRDVTDAVKPLSLYLHEGGRLDLTAPTHPEASDSYAYGAPSANTPKDFGGVNRWTNPVVPGGSVTYTTAPLAHDSEFLGSGSGNLWLTSTLTDADIELTLSEIRPDGQEEFVENGWLRLSHRKLAVTGTTTLRPLHTDTKADSQPLTPGVTTLARVELQPFDHVFRAGSSIRLTIDTPGAWLAALPGPGTIGVLHSPGTESELVLGDLPAARSHSSLPACAALLNQPCRKTAGAVPGGSLSIPDPPVRISISAPVRRGRTLRITVRATGDVLRDARVLLTDRSVHRAGASARFSIGPRARAVLVRPTHRLRPGAYRLKVTGRTPDGRRVSAARRYRVT